MMTTLPTSIPTTPTLRGRVVPEPGSRGAITALNRTVELPPAVDVLVRLVNEGETPFRARYLTDMYEIPVGGESFVAWDVMVNFLGNPNATNSVNRMDRREYLKRLRVKYGAYDDDVLWEENKPRLGAYSISTGERYRTIVDDPDGSTLHPATTTVADQAALHAQMAEMETRLKVLQQLAMQNAGGAVEPTSPAPPMPQPTAMDGTPTVEVPPQNPHGIFDTPPPGAVPLVPATGAVEDRP